MSRNRIMPALAALTALATAAAAAPLAAQDDEPGAMTRIVIERRARLGITVNLQARATDTLGAYVESVTPGGPAAKAGVRSGDVIVRFDGRSLLGARENERDAGPDRSLPGLRLIELAAKLEPNDTVRLELRRGDGWKERKTITVVAAEERGDFAYKMPAGEGPYRLRVGPPEGPGDVYLRRFEGPEGGFEFGSPRMQFFWNSPLGSLELAPLNPDLGQYFGASEGVLVISVPKDSKLGLKGGDVVLSVDGRKPSGPAHLLRILRSYEDGERFRIDVLRNRKRETVSGSLDRGAERTPGPMREKQPSRERS